MFTSIRNQVNSLLAVAAFSVAGLLLVPMGQVEAKCFAFKKGGNIRVCVDGNNNSARNKARDICQDVKGSSCGGISGYTGSCQDGSRTKCYDEGGNSKKKIKVN